MPALPEQHATTLHGVFPLSQTVYVSVPATTANIGPGFDCLGAALNRHNHFRFTRQAGNDMLTIQAQGPSRDRVPTDDSNLAYQAFRYLFQRLGQPTPAIHIDIEINLPLARGLGSSSTAIVGGLCAANAIAGDPYTPHALAAIATEIEGHPDNVVPALLGGCQLATTNDMGEVTLCAIPWHAAIVPVIVIPDFEVSTAAARKALPERYPRADVIYNLGHLGLLLQGLGTGKGDWLRTALGDRVHQPYRKQLIAGYDAVAAAALAAGAYGVTISGAGPTLLALASPEQAAAIAQAMKQAWHQQAVAVVDAAALAIDPQGAQVTRT